MAIQQDIFTKYAAGGIPPAFLRALAYRESGLNPNVVHSKSKATGLFQITAVVLKDYNAAQKTNFTQPQLTNPELNTKVAVWYIGRMLAAFRGVPALSPPNWQDRRFVELLVNGWNAGPNGLIGIIRKLEASGVPRERITVDAVNEAAKKLNPASYLAKDDRTRWAKAVASTYLTGSPGSAAAVASLLPTGGGTAWLAPVALGAVALGAVFLSKSQRSRA